MTNEEAIDVLMDLWRSERSDKYTEAEIRQALNMGMDALKHEQRWIPVTERLPEEYGEYMITWTTSHSMVNGKYGFLGIAEYELSGEYDAENNRFNGEWLLEEYVENYSDVKVTAWMSLPEPYKAESEET